MRRLPRWPARALAVFGILAAVLLVAGPCEPVEVDATFDHRQQ